jgi:hypothetical protein
MKLAMMEQMSRRAVGGGADGGEKASKEADRIED